MASQRTLVIACGALAREIHQLKKTNGWDHLELTCIDAALHFYPEKIPAQLRAKIRENRDQYADIYIAYAECGTRGEIDKIIEEEGIERLPGAHCYQFFAGEESFAQMSDDEPGTFYLTDFLVRHFDRLVMRSLGLDKHPELRDMYFGNYKRLIYLAQTTDEALEQAAREAAKTLGLEYEHVHTGYGELESSLRRKFEGLKDGEEDSHLLA
jgi:hypothetical protein